MAKPEHTIKTVFFSGQRWADLNAAQLLAALGDARPKTMASVNAKAGAWAQAQGYDRHVAWTVADLVDAGLAVVALKGRVVRKRDGGLTTVQRFRWVDQTTGRLL